MDGDRSLWQQQHGEPKYYGARHDCAGAFGHTGSEYDSTGTKLTCNADMGPAQVRRVCVLDEGGHGILRAASERLGLTARAKQDGCSECKVRPNYSLEMSLGVVVLGVIREVGDRDEVVSDKLS